MKVAALTLLLMVGIGSSLAQDKNGPPGPAARPGLTLASPDFADGGVIPDKFTMANPRAGSPKLEWANVPPATVTFSLILHDLDVTLHGRTDDVLHWMAFNIPGTARELSAGVAKKAELTDGTVQVRNTLMSMGYTGPVAPPSGPYHHYMFELFALDTRLDLGPNATRTDVLKAMEGHILAKGVLVGRFHR